MKYFVLSPPPLLSSGRLTPPLPNLLGGRGSAPWRIYMDWYPYTHPVGTLGVVYLDYTPGSPV